MQNSNTVHISNYKQYVETKIVRRNTVSGYSTLVMSKERCAVCTVDFRQCEFGSCRFMYPAGYVS